MTTKRPVRRKMVNVKAFAIVDVRKSYPRLCYNGAKGTKEQAQKATVAIYFKKPTIADAWTSFKKVVPVTVSFPLPITHRKKK